VSTAFHFKKCSAERGHLNPESVARALSRALPVSRRASYFASRVVSKCEFPRGFVGCSVPVLSCPQDRSTFHFPLTWFSQGFSHFWPIALELCSAHATRCMASCGENRVVFPVAQGCQNTGVLHRAEWYRAKSVKAVGFELDFPRCEDPLGTRIHENDGRIIILTIIRFLTVNRLISGGYTVFFQGSGYGFATDSEVFLCFQN